MNDVKYFVYYYCRIYVALKRISLVEQNLKIFLSLLVI